MKEPNSLIVTRIQINELERYVERRGRMVRMWDEAEARSRGRGFAPGEGTAWYL
jgi:hypothetical protein